MPKVRFEQSGPVGSIVLAGPPHNAISRQFVAELADAARQAGEPGVRALILRSEGPDFSTGAGAPQSSIGTYIESLRTGEPFVPPVLIGQ
jgi:enoyl-CoA hydratase/carnithine racemase